MERNHSPVRAPLFGWLRAALPLLILADLLLPRALTAQTTMLWKNVPKVTAERILTAQTQACRIAETAKGAELDGLDLALQRIIQQQENLVRKAAKDSAPALAAEVALRDAQAKLSLLEARLDPLLARRNVIDSEQKIYEDSMSTAARGDAQPGTKTRLEQVEEEMQGLDAEHGRFAAELAKIADDWLQGRDEQLKAFMKENREKWTRLRNERRDIVRRIHAARYNPQYQALLAQEEALEILIEPLQDQIKPLRETREAAKTTLADADLAAIKNLKELHEINGFLHQYLSYARDCVERRRGQLAQNVPPPAAGQEDVLTGTASGRWSGGCKYKAEGYVAGRPLTIGGTVNFQFDGAGAVSGTFVSTSGEFGVTSFPVVATLRADPDPTTGRRFWVENATGVGTGWSGTWQGQFGTIDGQFTGHGFNAPILTIQTSQWGEAECVATWAVP